MTVRVSNPVSIQKKLKTAKKLLDAGDTPSAENVLSEFKGKNRTAFSNTEKGEYEYLFGKILINSKAVKESAGALDYFNHSWYVYGNINGALEEVNLRMAAGDMDKNWRYIRYAYQYFLEHSSEKQKLQHPEVETNPKQTEPYHQADLAQQGKIVKQAKIDTVIAKREANRNAQKQEKSERQKKDA